MREMTDAAKFAQSTPKIADLDQLRMAGAEEESASIWRFPDGSKLKAQWSTGVMDSSGYLLQLYVG